MRSRFIFVFVFVLLFSFTAFSEEELISLNFKEVDIRTVLNSLSEKSGINIVVSPEVEGIVSIKLKDVKWTTALDVIVKTYGFGYEWISDEIVMVTTLEELVKKRKQETEAAKQEPLETITYKAKYLDANELKRVIDKQLTARGRVTVLDVQPKQGWKSRGGFGGTFEKAATRESKSLPPAKVLIITDTKSNVRNIQDAINKIDVMPKQILIEARIMEVNRNALKDLGLTWGAGSNVEAGTMGYISGSDEQIGVINQSHKVSPSVFGAKSSDITSTWPFNSGLSLVYEKLTGTQFEVLVHALEEDADTNTLSAPRVMTLDGQEAYIMIGEKRPIIESKIESSDSSVGISKNLKEYQPFGIELNVVPSVSDEGHIKLTLYPSVTSASGTVPVTSQIGETESTDTYYNISVREVQTQVLVKDGETIVIGGLLKDVNSQGLLKTPILGDIPLLGKLFQRKTNDTEKIDLIIFITASIVKEDEFTSEKISQLEERMQFNELE